MKHRILSIVLALCLCMAVTPAAHAEENIPTPQEVYETLIALKDQEEYCEGALWDDKNHSYSWNGGPVAGNVTSGTGCAAFAFELSDKAFGHLQARTFITGTFQLSDVRPGDILRVDNNSHSVIVLQVTEGGAIVAEGNYHVNNGPGTVHWGRTLTKAAVEAADFFITRYPEGYIPPDAPDAGEEIDSGTFGSVAWKLTKAGALTISGSGAMPDFDGPAETPWYAHMDKILTIIIENGVTNVGSSAFYGSAAISAVVPDSVTAIGGSAFYGAALVSVSIPGSVRTIGDHAFHGCENLVSASISEGVEAIGQGAFRACTELTSVTLPASVRSVGDAAFFECKEMAEAVFARSAADEPVAMGSDIFARCWNLSKVTLPQKAGCIGDNMFLSCLSLTSVNIPEGAASIGSSAFASCSALTVVAIPNSVKQIGIAAFSNCGALKDIYFGGSDTEWNSVQKLGDVSSALSGVTIHYNAEPPETPSTPDEHVHDWDPDWSNDSSCHWHECLAENCSITGSEKKGYGEHSYGDWVVDVNATASQSGSRHRTCTVCGYTQTESIPATGGSSSDEGGGSSSGEGGGSSSYLPPSAGPAVSATTTRNPDGSTTTTKTDQSTGTVTETTKRPDGSQTVTETQKDGTVTTWETDHAGNKTQTVANPDGSSAVIVERKGGTTAAVTVDAAGKAEAEVRLSALEVSAAQQGGEAVTLPIPEVRAARSTGSASTVTLTTGSEKPVKVKIPTAAPTPGTVAVIVRADGAEEIIKTSVSTADGVVALLPDGATVKIVDNSKTFLDIPSQHWAADAIDFVSARELFSGTTETVFTPEAPMTRAMLMTVLARFDGADTTGGATWYEKGMEWAVASGISDGSSPDQNITREQLITMLWRYAGSPSAAGALASFADADQISGYAQEAMSWAVENGIVSGLGGGLLSPQEQAVRAQVAQILKNFIEGLY